MYGAIIGDIVGSVYERRGKRIKTKDFPFFNPKGRPTDDSVMTVAVADVLVGLDGTEEDEVIRSKFVKSMQKWGRKYPNAGYGRSFREWIHLDKPQPYNSYGNGSAMRVSACGWLYKDMATTRRMARLSAEVTHNHPEGIKGAEATAASIFMARTGASKEDIKEYIVNEFGYDLNRICADIRPNYSFDSSCQGSVPEAIIAFLEGNDYEDVVREAVSLGGDADTQAAIAGSIAEAYYGIPEEIIEQAKSYVPEDMQAVIDKVTK